MPKSNSDADENDSLTSDDEAEVASPNRASFAPRDVAGPSPRSPVPTHRTARSANRRSRRPTMAAPVPSRIDPNAKPIDKFRTAVRLVMKMHRTHVALKDLSPGMEPDHQFSTPFELYGQYQQRCKVNVWDYGPTQARQRQFDTNETFINWLQNQSSTPRGLWNKVRWINISGVSWDILGALKQEYDLHPLSLDVVIHGRDNARSKADYYAKHLFIHILSHTLPPEDASLEAKLGAAVTDEPDPMDSPRHSKVYDPESAVGNVPYSNARRQPTRGATMATLNDVNYEKGLDLARARTRLGINGDAKEDVEDASTKADRKKQANILAIDALKQGTGQIRVDVKSVFMFLSKDGTLITIQRDPTREFGRPIYDRLRLRDTLLRSSGDASLLLQSLVDLVVDDAVKITDKYHRRVLKMERDILLKPKMRTVRDLHIASGDLTLHKRTMGPIAQLVYGLRRYDTDRTKAVTPPSIDGAPVAGFLSHQSKVYLADVHDHIEYILSSLDMFSSIAENLINYTFNIVSYETNQVMRGLTIATVIFFPLTFLTGYFGMNFQPMKSVDEHSEVMFWEIACPVMFVIIILFLWPDVRRVMHFLKKRAATKRFDTKKLQ